MGILSAFAVAVPGVLIGRVSESAPTTPLNHLWNEQPLALLVGSLSFLLSALFFYRERSLLAWFSGQLALSESLGEPPDRRRDLLVDADAWTTWIPYRWGFIGTYLGFAVYGIAFASTAHLVAPRVAAFATWACVGLALLSAGFYRYALTRYASSDHPIRSALLMPPGD